MDNPLTGPTGATYVYGPQKGGTPDKLKRLEEGMLIYRQRMIDFLGKDVNDLPGSGAAGGMGAGLMAFLDATTGSGFQIISETIALESIIKQEAFDYISPEKDIKLPNPTWKITYTELLAWVKIWCSCHCRCRLLK